MLNKLLVGIEKPGRYVGNETNSHCKSFEEASARFVLAFPDVYEVGLSHLGLRLLYHVLNRDDRVMADRVYAPWPDFEERLRERREPLRAIESERPIGEFDFVGFSLQYELSYTNILTILDLGGIPLETKNRCAGDPLVIAGGPCAFNAEPLADFLDFVVLGEAEQVLFELVEVFLSWKEAGGARAELLEEIRKIEGIYVPSLFGVRYYPSGEVEAIEPRFPDYSRVNKRLIPDLDRDSYVPERPVVPLLEIIHNRLGLEIARGCTRGCRFCQAGFIYRPVRERDPRSILENAEKALAGSGFEEVSLLSLSAGDYCQIQTLVASLIDRFMPERIAVSLPSMRVGTLTPELMEEIRRVRKTGFTLAPEAGSERLRRVINKEIRDEDLVSAAEKAFGLGWRLLKLYFMMGLPTENQSDLDAMVDLCMKVWQAAKPTKSSVNVSVSTFVPKAHTPFQWVSQLSRSEIESRLEGLRSHFRRPGLKFKWNDSGHSILEAVMARGDRRVGRVLLRAWELGARFDGWSNVFNEELWGRAFNETGLEPAFYAARIRRRDEILPWDHLSTRVDKDYLWREYERARGGEYTPDCRWNKCTGCGVCDNRTIRPLLHSGQAVATESDTRTLAAPEGEAFLYWLRYSKLGKVRFFGQLEAAQGIGRALRRAGLPVAYTKGFHPHAKLSFGEALPLGFESLAEEAHLTLTEKLEPEDVSSRLNEHLPSGLRIEEIALVSGPRYESGDRIITYRVSGLEPWTVRAIIQGWRQCLKRRVVKKTKRGEIAAELRDILFDVRLVDEASIEMDLLSGPQVRFRPGSILQSISGDSAERFSHCRICKISISPIEGLKEKEDVRRAYHQ
jgi:radical SAM family uncharacterized protein/radical SAM-linked protein